MGYSMAMDGIQNYDTYHQSVRSEKVLEVLKSYLANDELRKAMSLWESQYSQQPLEKLSFFIFELESNSDVRSSRRELLKKLETELKQDFSAEIHKQSVVQKPKLDLPQAKMEVQQQVIGAETLDLFFKNLLSYLSAIKNSERLDVCAEYLDETSLPSFLKEEVVSIVVVGGAPVHLITDAEHVRTTINMIYSILCEYFGPVKADKMLAKAVKDNAEAYPEEDLSKFL